jgi:hypothetical protein
MPFDSKTDQAIYQDRLGTNIGKRHSKREGDAFLSYSDVHR